MNSIKKILNDGYVSCLFVADRLAGGDVEIPPCSLFIPCGIRNQRIDCTWYFDEISCLSYYLYVLSELGLVMDVVVNYPIPHDASGWIVAELGWDTIEPE